MMPVLLKGDRLVVSKYPYGWSYVSPSFHPLPFLKGRIFGRLPERGDIVIVSPQNKREDYIKQVNGLPGDIVEVHGGQDVLQRMTVRNRMLKHIGIHDEHTAPSPPIQIPAPNVPDENGRRRGE